MEVPFIKVKLIYVSSDKDQLLEVILLTISKYSIGERKVAIIGVGFVGASIPPMEGEYGVEGVSMSLPSIIGVNGVEKRLIEHWALDEIAAFKRSSGMLKEVLQMLAEK